MYDTGYFLFWIYSGTKGEPQAIARATMEAREIANDNMVVLSKHQIAQHKRRERERSEQIVLLSKRWTQDEKSSTNNESPYLSLSGRCLALI
ncbi:hypothetical protein FRX31_004386 [Thalictrum thalictroides]|uniref:Uncharacterized protein n=1 Tax=Thalictrum thalictroides TaxID=46969 RepID=A0A7J6XAS1_THATH|nr:hypothetical protein FRX31_004386 [Thalictrum thalictroides]